MTWLRSQRVALTALVVSASAVAGVYLWLDALPVFEKESVTITEASDGTAEIAGQELVLESARWDEFPAPADSRVVSIRLRSSGGAEATSCRAFTLTEVEGSRTWLDGDDVVDVPYEEGESSCIEESAPYDIVSVFVVPDDAEGPFFLDIAGDGDVVVRFLVEP